MKGFNSLRLFVSHRLADTDFVTRNGKREECNFRCVLPFLFVPDGIFLSGGLPPANKA